MRKGLLLGLGTLLFPTALVLAQTTLPPVIPMVGTDESTPDLGSKETVPPEPKAIMPVPTSGVNLPGEDLPPLGSNLVLPASQRTVPASLPLPQPSTSAGMPIATQPGLGSGRVMSTSLYPGGSLGGGAMLGASSPVLGDGAPPFQRVYATAEYLNWWTKNAPVNTALLTEATAPLVPGTAPPGSLGSPNTNVLLGASNYGVSTRYGGRFTVGAFLDDESLIGVEGSYLFLAPSGSTKLFGSTPGNTLIGVPYTSGATGLPSFFPIAGTGTLPAMGGAFLTVNNALQGAELNDLLRLVNTENLTFSFLTGFRYLYFRETLDYGLRNQVLPNPVAPPGLLSSINQFEGVNNFFGGQIGMRGEYRLGGFFINGSAKLGLGAVYQTVNSYGQTVLLAPGAIPAVSGLLTPPSTSHATQREFALLPDFNINTGYNITDNIRFFVGWTFLYINNVVRPGQQINYPVTPFLPGPLPLNHTEFWAQGLNVGLTLGW